MQSQLAKFSTIVFLALSLQWNQNLNLRIMRRVIYLYAFANAIIFGHFNYEGGAELEPQNIIIVVWPHIEP